MQLCPKNCSKKAVFSGRLLTRKITTLAQQYTIEIDCDGQRQTIVIKIENNNEENIYFVLICIYDQNIIGIELYSSLF